MRYDACMTKENEAHRKWFIFDQMRSRHGVVITPFRIDQLSVSQLERILTILDEKPSELKPEDLKPRWNDHEPLRHEPGCEEANCAVCVQGLFICGMCGSAEGATTTNCPRQPLTAEQKDAVYLGQLDYHDGQWRLGPSEFCPHGSPGVVRKSGT